MFIGLSIALGILVWFVGATYGLRKGAKKGYQLGIKEEQYIFSLAFNRTFKDNLDEVAPLLQANYKQVVLEIEQEIKDKYPNL